MTEGPQAAGVVLAAGAGRRFGGDKLAATLEGRPILVHVVEAARAAGLDPVLVVVAPGTRIETPGATQVVNPQPELGLSSSLRRGLEAVASDVPLAVILLGDQPLVSPDVIRAVIVAAAAAPGHAAVPRYADGSGPNPVALGRPLFSLAEEARGDRGLGPLLAQRPWLLLEVPVDATNPDVDTPSDLDRLRAGAG